MPETVLAIATSDNAMGGAILTFAFPIILFAIIATVLWMLLFRPHHRVPAGQVSLAAAAGAPAAGAAHASAVAAGVPTASGGGSSESAAEPHGAKRDSADDGPDESGSVSGGADQGTEGTEASE